MPKRDSPHKVTRSALPSPLRPPESSRRPSMRVGRGEGSGKGKTCGRGQKGQKARSGYARKAGFEGGQMPLYRRLPKRGFRNPSPTSYQIVNLQEIERCGFRETVGLQELARKGLISSSKKRVKILAKGEIKIPLHITADAFSKGARSKIEGAGGSCLVSPALRQAGQSAKKENKKAKENTKAKEDTGAKGEAEAKEGTATRSKEVRSEEEQQGIGGQEGGQASSGENRVRSEEGAEQ